MCYHSSVRTILCVRAFQSHQRWPTAECSVPEVQHLPCAAAQPVPSLDETDVTAASEHIQRVLLPNLTSCRHACQLGINARMCMVQDLAKAPSATCCRHGAADVMLSWQSVAARPSLPPQHHSCPCGPEPPAGQWPCGMHYIVHMPNRDTAVDRHRSYPCSCR